MSDIIPPLLSSTPPPMTKQLEDDDDDEFGDFTAAQELSYGCDVLSLPTISINCVNESISNHCHEIVTNCTEKDFQDRRKVDELNYCDIDKIDSATVNKEDNVNKCYEKSELSSNTDNKYNNFQYFPDIPPDILPENIDNEVENELSFESSTNLDYCDINGEVDLVSSKDFENPNETLKSHNLEENSSDKLNTSELNLPKFNVEVDKFTNVSCENADADIETNNTSLITALVNQQIDDAHIQNNSADISEDYEFQDFDCAISNIVVEEDSLNNIKECDFDNFVDFDNQMLGTDTKILKHYSDEDFGKFNDCSVHTHNLSHENSPKDTEVFSQKVEKIILGMFDVIEVTTQNYQEEDFLTSNPIFSQLKDVTDTSALLYQWSKSVSQNCLLQALNIDTRNILYGPRWNESMPRYAATLGYTPLEPVKSEASTSAGTELLAAGSNQKSAELIQQLDIPSAQFDWIGSGLTNPLEMTPKKIVDSQSKESTCNIETKPNFSSPSLHKSYDNESVKSLQLIEESQLEDKTKQSHASLNEENVSNWPVPLRETYISVNDHNLPDIEINNVDKSSILKPNLLENESKLEDGFADFQISNCEVVPNEPEINSLQITAVCHNDEDDEFTDFQSTTCIVPEPPLRPTPILEPLKTTILQPIVTASISTINWPDPGITDEDISHIELYYKPNKEVVKVISQVNSISTNKSGRIDDDDWSDFVSNQEPPKSLISKTSPKTVPSRTATPELQLCVPQLNQIQFPKKPAPVITQNNSINNPIPIKPLVQSSVPQNTNTYHYNGFQPSLISHQFAAFNNISLKQNQNEEFDDEWTDFVSSGPPPTHSVIPNGLHKKPPPKPNFDWNKPPQLTSWPANVTPNIITNPVSFDSFHNFELVDNNLVKTRSNNIKNPNITQPKKSKAPNITTIPDLEFIAPKNRTWKK